MEPKGAMIDNIGAKNGPAFMPLQESLDQPRFEALSDVLQPGRGASSCFLFIIGVSETRTGPAPRSRSAALNTSAALGAGASSSRRKTGTIYSEVFATEPPAVPLVSGGSLRGSSPGSHIQHRKPKEISLPISFPSSFLRESMKSATAWLLSHRRRLGDAQDGIASKSGRGSARKNRSAASKP